MLKKTAVLFRWRNALVSNHGPISPTTRHVLLTLSLHMGTHNGSCFPSTKTLAKETALSERAVITHLKKARTSGWIKTGKHKKAAGQAWAGHQYQAIIPDIINTKGTEGGSVPLWKGAKSNAETTEPGSKKALKDVQSNSSVNSLNNSSENNFKTRSKPPQGFFDQAKTILKE